MKTYFLVLVSALLAACAIPYVEPFEVDVTTKIWRDRIVRGL